MMIVRDRSLALWARVGARGSDELLSHDSFTDTDDLVRAFIFHGHIRLCVYTVNVVRQFLRNMDNKKREKIRPFLEINLRLQMCVSASHLGALYALQIYPNWGLITQ